MEVIRITNLEKLKKRKFQPSDFNKKFITDTGEEYKIKFDANSNKIKIVKIVKAVLDGTFIKNKYADIAKDEQVKDAFKDKFTEIGKHFVDEINKENEEEKKEEHINSVDEIKLETFDDVIRVIEKIKDRKDTVLNLIEHSNVLNGNYDYEDELLLRDIRRQLETDIINEYDLTIEKYRDVLNGIYDSQVKLKLYNDEFKAKLEELSPELRLKILREFYAIDFFITSLEHIIKTFEDVKYKLESLPEVKLDVRNHTERQMFKDAVFTLSTCAEDSQKIKLFFENKKNILFTEGYIS